MGCSDLKRGNPAGGADGDADMASEESVILKRDKFHHLRVIWGQSSRLPQITLFLPLVPLLF